MATLLWLCGLLLCGLASVGFSQESSNAPHVVAFMRQAVGTTETHGPNRSQKIDMWNRQAGAQYGSSWCASLVTAALTDSERRTERRLTSPSYRGPLAKGFLRRPARIVTARNVLLNIDTVPAGSVVVWSRNNSWTGHVGITTAPWRGKQGRTIEGNTNCKSGTVSNGDGCCPRVRTIQPASPFRITHFVILAP